MKSLAIIGAGDLGQQVAHHAIATGKFKIAGFFDDFSEKGSTKNGYTILGGTQDVVSSYNSHTFDCLMVGIGYKHMSARMTLYQQYKNEGIPFATVIHPSVIIDRHAFVGPGSIIYPGCIIDWGVEIGENVLLNVGCCVAHDTKVGSHSFLAPRVAVAGFTHIGERNILGINCTLIDNIKTVDDVQVGAGGVVIKSIEQYGLYVGNPVRRIR